MREPVDLSEAILSEHAVYQMTRRRITADDVRRVLAEPEEAFPVRGAG